MELQAVGGLFRPRWETQPLEAWASQLQAVCGNYHPVPAEGRKAITGAVEALYAGGIDFAHVTKDLSAVERHTADIRRDDQEHLFLIIQLTGACGIEQSGRQAVLQQGDCILVDSTRPSRFVFSGRFSNQISVHLPRQTMYAHRSVRFEVASRLDRSDPMATTLRSLVAKMLSGDTGGSKGDHLKSLLYDATRLSFMGDDVVELMATVSGAGQRVELVLELIDRHLTEPELGPKWLAQRLSVSLRTLQEDFQSTGATCTAMIRDKRLKLAAELLERERSAGKGRSIADIAFACGFNDISYFNRSFREKFGSAPSGYLRGTSRPSVQ
ncbi:transcriptional regulator [Mesorhizobium sp. L-8-10]|uniref:helix-turn-helix domain-containing protein n=1 Tax=Mesorhizobium sp. L-8-10 TaxID=2744523 RepID=UPI0019258835|nr:helix-turn-helix domain-containing protein [Mesorhizobium sp. L-8-10]BCH30428.1 transcriptional regulator [Mesorhizobium sp. L-8-10]